MPDIESTSNIPTPMQIPPIALQKVPRIVIPPLVPGGTLFQGVITRKGFCDDSMPISEARVSPQQHA